MEPSEQIPLLIRSLLQQECFDHPADKRELIETHISWVILAGDFVYKIKKPVDLGFLDFSTLEKRRICCEEELRLNRRLAPGIYLSVVAIGGTAAQPQLDAQTNIFEYAVKMRRFPQEAQLDRVLERGELTAAQIDAFARMSADFHRNAEVATAESEWGMPQQVWQPMAENFSQIRQHLSTHIADERLTQLEQWSLAQYTQLEPLLKQRKRDGFIRECHGDLHLRNLAWVEDKALAFDCIEFNPALRWIDVISDIAFLVMDLRERGEPRLAHRFLNTYLEIGGDYQGLCLLPFYLVYRAMVRAKVAAIRCAQQGISDAERVAAESEYSAYLAFAEQCSMATPLFMIVVRGLSASGKSKHSGMLLEWLGAVRLRSDVERKRLFGLRAEESGHAAPGEGIYNAAASEQTYERLAELAATVLEAGYPVIIDAVCLKRSQRERFYRLAQAMAVPLMLLEFQAPETVLRQRIVQRKSGVSDAGLAVLEQQLAIWEPLADDERNIAMQVDTSGPLPESSESLYLRVYEALQKIITRGENR